MINFLHNIFSKKTSPLLILYYSQIFYHDLDKTKRSAIIEAMTATLKFKDYTLKPVDYLQQICFSHML